ncbi:MAG TPA: endonuclease/exonuclease/phosphatase family protein [Solirubrobacteraceae bacterium]
MLIVTWNLFHGRSLPPSRGSLYRQFAEKLRAWEWDVALLQEVPPWWPPSLASDLGAEQRTAATSRNSLLAVRRAIAERRPELAKSNGGGANAVLAREPIAADASLRLRTWPERRVAQLVRLRSGVCAANYHGTTRVALAEDELARVTERALAWAGGAPLVLGGDLNLRAPAPSDLVHVAARDVDHLFARGLELDSEPELLDRSASSQAGVVELSDHPPLRVGLSPPR